MTLRSLLRFPALLPVLAGLGGPAQAALSWTDLADLALAAPVVLSAEVRSIDRLGPRSAPDVPPGEVRALVEAGLTSVLKAPAVLPAGAAWLWQGEADRRGRPPFAKQAPVLLFARPLAGGADPAVQALALVAPHAQQPWSAETDAAVRAILRQAQTGSVGLVTAVVDAAHSAGEVDGASESQMFLSTEAGRPLTLIVRRAAGAPPLLLAATGELVSTAGPVERRTLLWRALACGLPEALPPALAADPALERDYRFARQSLGACGRTVAPPKDGTAAPSPRR